MESSVQDTRQLLHRARCGSFSQKIETASWAKPANPECFILLCQLYFSRLSLAMPAKLNFFKTPASVRLVSSQPMSTSTGISGCYQQTQADSHAGSKVYIWNVFGQDIYSTQFNWMGNFLITGRNLGHQAIVTPCSTQTRGSTCVLHAFWTYFSSREEFKKVYHNFKEEIFC